MNVIGRYFVNIVLSIDQLFNSILCGDPDETISSRLGRIKEKYKGTIPMTRPISKLSAYLLNKHFPNHCEQAYQNELDKQHEAIGHNGIVDKKE